MTDALGDRMKDYERRETDRRFLPLLPVYARIDGRAFSRFTEGLSRPFDAAMARAMIETTRFLVAATQARTGYTQSDEISLVWQAESYGTEMLFGGKIQKTVSLLAGMASTRFMAACLDEPTLAERARRLLPAFDARVFQLPNRTEAANTVLWRERDATKNAIQMAARSVYPHAECTSKTGPQLQEMLFAKGINFNDYPAVFKRGTFVRPEATERQLTGAELARIPERYRTVERVTRTEIVELEMPPFATVTNREGVIFDGEAPVSA